ncbi:MAG: glycosyltransferase [Phycisphaerales bacterium]|nr:glycosyltransferase [Phycisphaerales bacterium]
MMASQQEVSTHPNILIIGGGSGGHISPGLAVAESISEMGGRCHVLCSERAIDRSMLEDENVSYQSMPARPFSTRPAGLWRCLRGIRQCTSDVNDLMATQTFDGVLALGGFVAASVMPGILKARRSGGIDGFKGKVILLNLDRIPGKANRQIARKADLVLTAVDTVQPGFASMTTGLPIRSAAMASGTRSHCRIQLGLDPDRTTLLVTGASQGASSLNKLMFRLIDSHRDRLQALQIIHLSGQQSRDELAGAYETAGIRAVVHPFMHEMGLAWGAASMTISRAGANSVAEIQANAIPAIFLPYPHHRDQHQFHNARPLVDAGGSHVVEDLDDETTAGAVADLLFSVFQDSASHQAMASALQAQARPEAARRVISALLDY